MHRYDRVSGRSRALGRELVLPAPPAHPVLELQRAIGNHATTRMLSRVLKTTRADLTAPVQAAKTLVGDEYTKLCKVLDSYHADPATDSRLTCVYSMQVLGERWLANAESFTPDDPRVAKVQALVDELPGELADLKRELRHLEQLRGQDFKWISARATKEVGNAAAMAKGQSTDSPGTTPKALQIVKDAGLSEADIAAIRIYTTEDFKYINPAMAGNMPWLQTADEYERPHATMRALYQEFAQMSPSMRKAIAEGQNQGRRGGPKKEGMEPTEAFNEGGWRAIMSPEDWEGFAEEGVEHGQAALRALKKLKPFPGPTYRGEQLTKEEAEKRYSRGAMYTAPTFYSTSKEPAVAKFFAHNPKQDHKPVKIEITFDQETGRDVSALSAAPPPKKELADVSPQGEQEVLLLPGTTIEVVDVVKRGNEWQVSAREVDAPVELEAEDAPAPFTVHAENVGEDEAVALEAQVAATAVAPGASNLTALAANLDDA